MHDERRPDGVVTVAPGIRRVIAPNPGPMTHWGTNSYVLGQDALIVVDPGPDDAGHLALLADLPGPGQQIEAILVTHAHRDHSAGGARLAQMTGAPIAAFGNATAGRTPIMAQLAAQGCLDGGEGVDDSFTPDICLADGDGQRIAGQLIDVLWTPGHMANHLCFAVPDQGVVLTGDLVMGWTSTLISPPDGDVRGYLGSLDRLAARDMDRLYMPGHGAPIPNPAERVAALRAHRVQRHAQIRAALAETPGTAQDIAKRVYSDLPIAMLPMATRNTFAHLIVMVEEKEVIAQPDLSPIALFHRC